MELPPYLRLQQEEEGSAQSLGGDTQNPIHAEATDSNGFILRVLNKESKVEINSLQPQSTIRG